jgi:hypothetical protein
LSLKKIDQRFNRFLWPLFQDSMTGVWQHNDVDVVGDEFHLRAELVA